MAACRAEARANQGAAKGDAGQPPATAAIATRKPAEERLAERIDPESLEMRAAEAKGRLIGRVVERQTATGTTATGVGPTSPPFALKQESARGRKPTTFESTGGRTPFLLDMKRGDLPGQTSLLEQVGMRETHERPPEPVGPTMQVQPTAPVAPASRSAEARRALAERLRRMRRELLASRVDPATHTQHAPGTVTPLDTGLIYFDPNRFQYKLDVSDIKTGSVGSLAGVRKWDPELAGTIAVWKDPADGKAYVVNGHNRLDLAKRLGVGRVDVRFLQAADATEARAKGALTNIAEGRGSVLDAAKFFRDSGIATKAALEERGIPLGEAKARQGLELAGLAAPLFRRVIDGTLPAGRGAIIGGAGLSDDQQMKVAQLAEGKRVGGREITDSHLREIVDEVRSAPTRTRPGGGGLFGDDPEAESLALHRTALTSAVKERLAREKRLFGTVAKKRAAAELGRAGNVIRAEESGRISQAAGEALDTFDRLKRSTGPVSAALNHATLMMAGARGPAERKAIQDQLYEEILYAVQQAQRFAV